MSSTEKMFPENRKLPDLDTAPISILEKVRVEGRVWSDLCDQYGVTNPDPPWKVNLESTCDALAEEACALPVLERRWEEDELSESLYADVPFPERQLLALAHSMIRRGIFDEEELSQRMQQVHDRLNMV
ncbi:MAG: hypothetical protein H6953_00175 [Chromatiaceae bacterium]|nr:hypothetical protein [Chromatiaceae bacterium]MCP5313559.1 hypothetical protein [Chromatiaceae bacterium]